jgi:hypothetical protein
MKNAHPFLLWSVVLLLALAGCGAVAGCAKMDAPAPAAALASMPAAAATSSPVAPAPGMAPADRAMRITIETSVEVTDLPAASAAVRAAVGRAGGYVGEAHASGGENFRMAWFEVHVPVPALPAFRAELGKLGEITADAERAEDVTEQRADIKARLGNARAEEKRLLELLDKHTGNLADVVAVEKELASVRETIERMEAQERVLEGQIATATVKVQLSVRHVGGRVGPGRRIVEATGDGFENAGSFLVGLTVAAASAGPTLILIAAMGYAIFRVVRFLVRRSRKRATPPAP